MSVLPIGEARRRLPELVRKVAAGHPPVAIGRRGHVEAVLVAPIAAPHRQVERRPLRGLLTLVGSDTALERAQDDIRRLVAASLERTARQLQGPVRRTRRRRP